MRAVVMIVQFPKLKFLACVVERAEKFAVQALVAQSPVEVPDARALHGVSGPAEIETYASFIGPGGHLRRRELWAVVGGALARRAARLPVVDGADRRNLRAR